MFRQSKNPVMQRTLVAALLDALTVRPGAALFAGNFLSLVSAGPGTINQDWTFSMFTTCDFSGYANLVIADFSGPANLPSSFGTGIMFTGVFTADDDLVPPGQTAIGYHFTGTADASYIAEYFDEPVQFAAPGDSLLLQVWVPIMNPGNAS